MRLVILSMCLLMALLWPAGLETGSVAAQSDAVIWNSPFTLTDTPQNSEYPAIVADAFGYVHLFWSEDLGGEPLRDKDNPNPGNSIMYTRWNGGFWTGPEDILSVPGDPIAKFVAVHVDSAGRLHAVWTGQASIYYSHAPSWAADSARAWSKPIVIATDSARSAWESSVATDRAGNVHIVYATKGGEAGVYHVRSSDGGTTWESPVRLSKPFDRLETSFSHVKMVVDGAGRLQVVWQTDQEKGYGQAIYHTRSLDEGRTWSPPVQLDYRGPGDIWVEWPYLVALGESELHLIYVSGANVGRAHRISTDGGETWSEPTQIITEMEGINGYVFPLVDGAGQMHLIINMRTRAQVLGLFYASWLGNGWSPVEPLLVDDPALGATHYTVGTVRLGNELHIAWAQPDKGEISYLSGVIPSVPQTPARVVPSAQVPTPSPALPATAVTAGTKPTPVASQLALAAPTFTGGSPQSRQVFDPAIVAAGVSAFLVAGVMLWARRRPR